MLNKVWYILAGAIVAVSIASVACIMVFPPCSACIETAAGGCMPMKCHWTFRAEIPIAILLLLTAVGQFFLKQTESRCLSSLFLLASSIVGLLLMTNVVIGICAHDGSMCGLTALVSGTAYALIIVAAIIQLVTLWNSNRHKRRF
jgi:hypothetical protein